MRGLHELIKVKMKVQMYNKRKGKVLKHSMHDTNTLLINKRTKKGTKKKDEIVDAVDVKGPSFM